MIRAIWSVAAILIALTGCGPAAESTSNVARNAHGLQPVQQSGRPEITTANISSDIVGRKVPILELTGSGPEDEWTFDAAEFRQADILEKRMTQNGLTLVIFMTTRNNPGPDEIQLQVTGKLQLRYEWRAGKWMLVSVENLTFRYSVGQST
jgi:hypothetical protein